MVLGAGVSEAGMAGPSAPGLGIPGPRAVSPQITQITKPARFTQVSQGKCEELFRIQPTSATQTQQIDIKWANKLVSSVPAEDGIRADFVSYLMSLDDSQLNRLKTFSVAMDRDFKSLATPGSVLNELNKFDRSNGPHSGWKELLSYYKIRVQNPSDVTAYDTWLKTELHALFIIENLYLSTDPGSKQLLSQLRLKNQILNHLKLMGMKGPPFGLIKDQLLVISEARWGFHQLVKLDTWINTLALSRAEHELGLIGYEYKRLPYGLSLISVGEKKSLKFANTTELMAFYRKYLNENNDRSSPLFTDDIAGKMRRSAIRQSLLFGLEVEYIPSQWRAILEDYRPHFMGETEWLNLEFQQRSATFSKYIQSKGKKAEFHRTMRAPIWLPSVIFGENNGNLEINRLLFNSFEEVKKSVAQFESRYGVGSYQGHVSFPTGLAASGLAGYTIFESDLAQLKTLERNYILYQKNSTFDLARNLYHPTLGPLGVLDQKKIVEAEARVLSGRSAPLGLTRTTYAPVFRLINENDSLFIGSPLAGSPFTSPPITSFSLNLNLNHNFFCRTSKTRGRIAFEFRQFHSRSNDLLGAMQEFAEDVVEVEGLEKWSEFANVRLIDRSAAVTKLLELKFGYQVERVAQLVDNLSKYINSINHSKMRVGGAYPAGERVLFPLRDWGNHPAITGYPDWSERLAAQSRISMATRAFARDLGALASMSVVVDEQMAKEIKVLVARWAFDAKIATLLKEYKSAELLDTTQVSLQKLTNAHKDRITYIEDGVYLPNVRGDSNAEAKIHFQYRKKSVPVYNLKSDYIEIGAQYSKFLLNSIELIYSDEKPIGHIRLRIGDRIYSLGKYRIATRKQFESHNLDPGKNATTGYVWRVPFSHINKVIPEIEQLFNNTVNYNLFGFDRTSRILSVRELHDPSTYKGLEYQRRHGLSLLFSKDIDLLTGFRVSENGEVFIETPDGNRIEAIEDERGLCVQGFSCSTSATYILHKYFAIDLPIQIGADSLNKLLAAPDFDQPPDAIIRYK
jgi:hypothetical protein